jgi:hypothetical protein
MHGGYGFMETSFNPSTRRSVTFMQCRPVGSDRSTYMWQCCVPLQMVGRGYANKKQVCSFWGLDRFRRTRRTTGRSTAIISLVTFFDDWRLCWSFSSCRTRSKPFSIIRCAWRCSDPFPPFLLHAFLATTHVLSNHKATDAWQLKRKKLNLSA